MTQMTVRAGALALLVLGHAAGAGAAPLALTFVRIRPQAGLRPNGSIVLRGEFATAPPADTFGAAAGVTLRVTDGLAVDRSVDWTAADCVTFPAGGIRCTRPSPGVPHKIRLDPIAQTAGWRFVVRLKNLDAPGPFQAPVTAEIGDHGDTERTGAIATCTTTSRGALNCRPPR